MPKISLDEFKINHILFSFVMPEIPDSLKKLLDEQKLGYVATVSEDGTPNLSPKGTIIPWNENTLAFADIRSPNTIRNLEKNPHLEINVVDPLLRKGFRIKGTGQIIKNGPEYEKILEAYRQRGVQSPIGAIVLVQINMIDEVTSPLYDLGFTEEQIKDKWKKQILDL